MDQKPYNTNELPDDLPEPHDDGLADRLVGMAMPSLSLMATDGEMVDLSALKGLTVVFAYPRTGEPNKAPPEGWNDIPGARGCTPQACSFRDLFTDLKALGVSQLYGLSSQTSDYQREARDRLNLPYQLLSDPELDLAKTLAMPIFAAAGMILYKRLTLIIRDGVIDDVLYPVFPADRSAADVIEALQEA